MKIQLLSLVSAAVALSLPEMPALPDLVQMVENSVHGNFTAPTVEEPKALLPTIAEIRAMTDQERIDRFHWFFSLFLLVFLCVVISGTIIMVVAAELKAFGSYQALGETTPLSKGAQLRLVMLSFGGTVLLSFAATLWSMENGRLSKTFGLDWEIYLLLFGCASASLLVQAVLAVAWLKAGDHFDLTAFAVASFSSMAPFLSDQWDTLKDIIFGGLCLQSQHWFMKIVGVLSWSYLVAFHAWFFLLAAVPGTNASHAPGANCFNELAASHLSVLLLAPKVQGEWSGGCWEGIILPTIYKQVTKSKRHHLLIENVPQALMSVLFLAVEGGSFFVAALNLVIPGVQIALTFLLFKPVRAAAIPALGKRLNRAMRSGNTIAAKALWEEVEFMEYDRWYDSPTTAEITEQRQLFALMLPHLTFFLDLTKSCGFMSEELKDLGELRERELKILRRMAGVFAGQDRNLSGCQIGDSGAKALAEGLKSNGSSAWLKLDGSNIGDRGAEALAESLKTNGSLGQLFLGENNIGDRGAEALAESLKTNGSLGQLDLGKNNIGDRGAEALAESLKTNGTLSGLFLQNSNIGDRGAEALAESLKTNGSLGQLFLGENNIGDRGAEALAAGLLQNRSLRRLSLSRDSGYRLWGLWLTQGGKALEEAEKIKRERGEVFEIYWYK